MVQNKIQGQKSNIILSANYYYFSPPQKKNSLFIICVFVYFFFDRPILSVYRFRPWVWFGGGRWCLKVVSRSNPRGFSTRVLSFRYSTSHSINWKQTRRKQYSDDLFWGEKVMDNMILAFILFFLWHIKLYNF